MSPFERNEGPREAIMKFIREYMKLNVVPPTMREIAIATGIEHPSVVLFHIRTLVSRGDLRIAASGKSRVAIPADARIVFGNGDNIDAELEEEMSA